MSYQAVLRNKNFRNVLLAQLLSKIGDMVTGVALPLLIFSRTGSVASMAFMMLTYWLPNLILAPFFGIVVDRVNRKKLMLGMDIARALLIGLIPFVPLYGIYLICFLTACASEIFDLAKFGSTKQLVKQEELVEANSLVQGLDHLIGIAGPALAGILIAATNLVLPFYVDVATFSLSALLMCFVAIPDVERKPQQEGWLEKSRLDFKEGLSFVKTSAPLLFSMTLFLLVMMFAMPMNVLFYPLFQGELGAVSWQIGLILSLFSVSSLLGTIVSPKLNRRFNRIHLILLGLFCMGFFSALLALSQNVYLALAFYALGAFFNGFVNPLNATLRQENIPHNLMGRVTGMYFSAVNSLSLVSMLLIGLFGDLLAVRDLYLAAGIGYAVVGLLGFFSPWYAKTKGMYETEKTALEQV
ncbi:MFS-type transporter involved in bile tolerance (Atg22 family) [Tumebacillus sp. BK434]|uniref:MFS transporter n=1 Tax=Tumebacillus sp. BK434 TaxID=2512169 RepID=UPI00104FE8F2|nr:MFS transporter [Tumebacillus sp. BK434]TCP53709.1 MFS-type transporter involved in bile tolerance (Atg22 family) [Tumebacillus sp. BK434]